MFIIKHLKSFPYIVENYEIIEIDEWIDILKPVLEDLEKKDNKIKVIFTNESKQYLRGSEAIRIFKRKEYTKRCYYICITACEDKDWIDMILLAGADKVYKKPVSKKMCRNN